MVAAMVYPLVCMCYGLFLGMAAARQPEPTADFPRVVKYPDAASAEDLGRAKTADATNEKIKQRLRDLLDDEAHIEDAIGTAKGRGIDDIQDSAFKYLAETEFPDELDWVFEMSSLYMMEAPVMYLTPPSISPEEQFDADKEVEDVLVATGLENKPTDVSEADIDPFQITSLSVANTAIKSCKSELEALQKKHGELSKRMRSVTLQMSTDRSRLYEYKSLKQEMSELDRRMNEDTKRLVKLEHVKEALIKKQGAGKNVEDEEGELEHREGELSVTLNHQEQFSDL
ncbi:hypothetical protein X943_000018 [Babesia divergens]|uniref:Uncharacterized protein n=1 Tax=Babesia divergens TaxID=32595 RepID=A0AAD9LE80_BABDI|nr:hypothetical protein X943_000018 [Babesia divergens]